MTTKTTEMNTCFCSVSKVYLEPLAAALNSNRTILNYADIQIIFNPVTQILELNRWPHPNTHQNQYVWCTQLCGHKLSAVCFGCSVFQEDLQTRLQQWGPQQCVGDVFVKLCSRLRVYTNYLNNYTTALCTIDKVNKTVVLSIQHSIRHDVSAEFDLIDIAVTVCVCVSVGRPNQHSVHSSRE